MYDTVEHNLDRGKSKLHEMAVLGIEYREETEIEIYGEEMLVYLKPIPDKKFLPMLSELADHFDYDEDEDEDFAASEAIEEVAEDRNVEEMDSETIDVEDLDDEFVDILQEAAVRALVATRDNEDSELVPLEDKEEKEAILSGLLGGKSVELGALALKITGDARDAEKFREERGSLDGGNIS